MTARSLIPDELWNLIPPTAQAALLAVFAAFKELEASNSELKASNAELKASNAELKARVKELEARLNQNSSNSSKPPSSDPPYAKPAPPRKPSGKRKGGQPGHPKNTRPLLPASMVVELRPESCRDCGKRLSGTDPKPLIHQVVEIPPVHPHVTEYRRHQLCCRHCQRVNCPPLPADAQSGFGPRVQAITAILSGGYRLGKRPVAGLLRELFGVPISTGAVCNLQHRTSETLAPIAAEARNYLVGRPANVDETSWVEGRKEGWLWVAVTRWVTGFLIRPSRARAVLKELIPGEPGLLTTDRYSAYCHLENRQLCWAHLRRDFQALIDRKDEGSSIGEELLRCANRLLRQWKRVRDGTLTRQAFRTGPLVKIRATFNKLVNRWSEFTIKPVRFACYELSQLGESLWRFAEVDGVEPTNNAAERALRHAVCWRKMSYGTDSARGSRFVERILTVIESCRQQGKNLLSFLTNAVLAARTTSMLPSLIPIDSPPSGIATAA